MQNHHDDSALEGPFTPKQMRALKWLTGTMGVMIVICVILLGIGLSRQSAKLASDAPTPDIALSADEVIVGITADGHDGIWLHSRDADGERIQYYKASGKKGPAFNITRE